MFFISYFQFVNYLRGETNLAIKYTEPVIQHLDTVIVLYIHFRVNLQSKAHFCIPIDLSNCASKF